MGRGSGGSRQAGQSSRSQGASAAAASPAKAESKVASTTKAAIAKPVVAKAAGRNTDQRKAMATLHGLGRKAGAGKLSGRQIQDHAADAAKHLSKAQIRDVAKKIRGADLGPSASKSAQLGRIIKVAGDRHVMHARVEGIAGKIK